MALAANPADTAMLVPAFTGLGAPYWMGDAKALLCGMTRLTGKNEIVRAALDCIALQVRDVVAAMEKDCGAKVPVLRVDGGPTRNNYLMQFQSDMLNAMVSCPDAEELSGIGAAYMAGQSAGIFTDDVFQNLTYRNYAPTMPTQQWEGKLDSWRQAIRMISIR
jgi:glycerol kinase